MKTKASLPEMLRCCRRDVQTIVEQENDGRIQRHFTIEAHNVDYTAIA